MPAAIEKSESKMLQVLLLLLLALAAAGAAGAPLGRYWVNASDVHVSGLSAGAYAAVQFHVAFSDRVRGAGVLAGGPYYCARGSVSVALTACMTSPSAVDVDTLIDFTDDFAAAGDIAPTVHLQGAPVYIFAGTRDGTVDPALSRLLEAYYVHYVGGGGASVRTEYTLAAGHAHITDSYGNPCATASQSPYISNCAYDMAGVLLGHVTGRALQPRRPAVAAHLTTFEQGEFGGRSMDALGYVYVPAACADGQAACGVHVALHGCLQARSNVGDAYAAHTGYNEWAEANNIIVLYPQADADALLGNPNACFDCTSPGSVPCTCVCMHLCAYVCVYASLSSFVCMRLCFSLSLSVCIRNG
jgi:poly(3-hydroxybutyrate) depolymerase